MSKGQIPYARMNKRRQSENIGKKTQGDMTIYDEVQKDMSPDFLAYINELVKPVHGKTPIKPVQLQLEQKVQTKNAKQPNKISRRSSIDREQFQINRLPTEGSKTKIVQPIDKLISKKVQRPKAASFFGKKKGEDINQLKKTRNIDDLLKTRGNTISHNLNLKPSSNYQSENTHNFLQKMDEYVHNLQKQTAYDQYQKPKLLQYQQLKYQNKVLKNKLKHYESRFQQIQEAVTQMLGYSKKRQKQLKKQVHELNKALIAAVQKINNQKEQMDYLKDFLSNFSQQLQIYNDGRLNKHKLDKLLGQRDYDQRRVEQALLKSLRSDLNSEHSNNSSVQRSKDLYRNTQMTPMYMPSRSKTSSHIVHKFNISKSNSKDSRQLKSKNKEGHLKNKFREHSQDTQYQR